MPSPLFIASVFFCARRMQSEMRASIGEPTQGRPGESARTSARTRMGGLRAAGTAAECRHAHLQLLDVGRDGRRLRTEDRGPWMQPVAGPCSWCEAHRNARTPADGHRPSGRLVQRAAGPCSAHALSQRAGRGSAEAPSAGRRLRVGPAYSAPRASPWLSVAAWWKASRMMSELTSTEATVGRGYVPCACLPVDRPHGRNSHAHADRSRPTCVECSPHSRLVCAWAAFLCLQASNAAVVVGSFGRSRRGRKVLSAYEENAPRSVDWLHSGRENGLAGGRLQAGRGHGPGGQARREKLPCRRVAAGEATRGRGPIRGARAGSRERAVRDSDGLASRREARASWL